MKRRRTIDNGKGRGIERESEGREGGKQVFLVLARRQGTETEIRELGVSEGDF